MIWRLFARIARRPMPIECVVNVSFESEVTRSVYIVLVDLDLELVHGLGGPSHSQQSHQNGWPQRAKGAVAKTRHCAAAALSLLRHVRIASTFFLASPKSMRVLSL